MLESTREAVPQTGLCNPNSGASEVVGESTPAVLRFENVTKIYSRRAARMLLRKHLLSWFRAKRVDTFHALRDISFMVERGRSLAVVGANGAGKSTLLRLATGISFPDNGTVSVHGRIAALMELGAGFHPDLTGRENILLNGSLLGFTRKQTYEQFHQILEFSGIQEFIDEPLRTYSSGMILRLAFAVAVRVDPDILVIDEILAVGDQEFQRKCVEEIKRLKQRGKTLVCASHTISVLRELCEEALWLEHGKVRLFGPAQAVLDSYEAGGSAASA
jgi:lipopolysaccharide transport system ATP-binding protein